MPVQVLLTTELFVQLKGNVYSQRLLLEVWWDLIIWSLFQIASLCPLLFREPCSKKSEVSSHFIVVVVEIDVGSYA